MQERNMHLVSMNNKSAEWKHMREILVRFSELFIRLLLINEAKNPASHGSQDDSSLPFWKSF
jgi:hypothetical protein